MPILVNNPKFRNYYNKISPVLRDKRAPAYFMLILSFLSLSFFGAFALRPTLATITELQKEIDDSKEVYTKIQEKNRNLLILQAEYKTIESDLPIIYAAIPNQVDAPTFLLKLKTLATLNNLEISNLQITKSPLSEGVDSDKRSVISSTFSLTASGTYKNINKFLEDVASLDRIATFTNIGITQSSGSTNGLTVQVSGQIYTLFD